MATRAREQEADRAAAAGDFATARALLEEAAQANASDPGLWMKLSALRKSGGDLVGALAAIERSLALAPREFAALLQRALLLERLGDARSSEAFGHALAQLPPGAPVPQPMQSVIAHARERWEQHSGAVEDHLRRAIPEGLSPEVRRRADRLASNRSRRTRHFHQEPTEFHYPAVPEIEFHDRSNFPQLELLDAATEDIRKEFDALMCAEAAEMVPYIQYPEHVPLAQWKELNNSREWTAVHLLRNGERIEANARHCPKTMEVISRMDQPQIRGGSPNAMFSLLAPRTRIPPHTGVANTRLVCHLPLIVPGKCGFRVGASTCEWRVGEAFVFDDTIEHEAWNDSDQLRVVLIIDLWQPSLSGEERRAITAVIEAAGVSFAGG
ncbi:MAG TPA: aspartyl/asparaginyl beta-hydroxylase domain-containing protein [Sphingomicrobium sp.]|nr:aspartyl/asparaginyl beta-hydroxylase domain-containing protein [Sphingomicrobium sp.]